MKNFTHLKRLALLVLLGFGYLGVSAQTPSTLEAKQEHQNMSGANYDIWKATRVNAEVEPNKVLSTTTSNAQTTYLVRLGWQLLNLDAASAYENKLQAQPGVISVDVDQGSNTVEITIKEEDEHDALRSLFNIE